MATFAVMAAKLSLREYIIRSREAVRANKAKGNRHAEILAGMYTHPARFIEEIIQNAEDACARRKDTSLTYRMVFSLFPDRVEVHHNGKDFDEDDLISVTSFANTTKSGASALNMIGKFGIGFKSVYAVCRKPEIHSGEHHYRIQDYEIPEPCHPRKPANGMGTLIVLPFIEKTGNQIYQSVKNGLLELCAWHLLFLRYVECIEVIENDVVINSIRREVFSETPLRAVYSLSVLREPDKQLFLVFRGRKNAGSRDLQIAYPATMSLGKLKLMPLKAVPLFVYFPTRMSIPLGFILNGPFTTNPLREHIPFDETRSPENIELLKQAALLFARSLSEISRMGLSSVGFLSTLPLSHDLKESADRDENLVLAEMHKVLIGQLENLPLIPDRQGKMRHHSTLICPGDEETAEVAGEDLCRSLFRKPFIVHPEILLPENKMLAGFLLQKLGVKLLSPESFAFRLGLNPQIAGSAGFNRQVLLCTYLTGHPELWDEARKDSYFSLRTKAIIPGQDGKMYPPFGDDGQPAVFLGRFAPGGIPRVKSALQRNQACMQFFRLLGLREPDAADRVFIEVFPALENDQTADVREVGLRMLMIYKYFVSAPSRHRALIGEELRKLKCIPVARKDGSETAEYPNGVYHRCKDLLCYFAEDKAVCFVAQPFLRMLKRAGEDDAEKFLYEAGVLTFPAVLPDGRLHGWDNMIHNQDIKPSAALVRLILSRIKAGDFVPGFDLSLLKSSQWLRKPDGSPVSPAACAFSNLHSLYRLSAEDAGLLCRFLGTEIAARPQFSLWMPEVNAHEAKLPEYVAILPEMSGITEETGKSIQMILQSAANPENRLPNNETNFMSPAQLEDMRSWSMEFTFRYLKSLNYTISGSHSALNPGCFKVSDVEGRTRVFGLAAKTTIMNVYVLLPSCWQELHFYHSVENLDTAMILVSGAGSKNPDIRVVANPIGLFINKKASFNGWLELLI